MGFCELVFGKLIFNILLALCFVSLVYSQDRWCQIEGCLRNNIACDNNGVSAVDIKD